MSRRQQHSIIEDHGACTGSCGYCDRTGNTFKSHGMHAHTLRVDDYQGLLDVGWRRSGCWMYKPRLEDTCCPPYTIRLDVDKFQPSKSQRKVLRRLQTYLEGEEGVGSKGNGSIGSGDGHRGKQGGSVAAKVCGRGKPGKAEDASIAVLSTAVARAMSTCITQGSVPAHAATIPVKVAPAMARAARQAGATHTCAIAIAATARAKAGSSSGGAADAVKVAEALAKALSSDGELAASEVTVSAVGGHLNFCAVTVIPSSIAQASPSAQKLTRLEEVNGDRQDGSAAGEGGTGQGSGGGGDADKAVAASEVVGGGSHAMEVDIPTSSQANANGNLEQRIGDSEAVAGSAGQSSTMEAEVEAETGSGAGLEKNGVQHKKGRQQMTMTMARSTFVEEEYQLWTRYQSAVHGEDPCDLTRSSFKRFLCNSPLGFVPPNSGSSNHSTTPRHSTMGPTPSCGFGSFHQQYRIDGKLVAVGVVDVLPLCLSSKYFFWDPDLAHLALGKVSSLKEIEWVRNASRECPTLRYYYMGYYIHSCPKMRYKADYSPSDLLCPVTGRWVPFDTAKSVLDSGVYGALDGSGGVALGDRGGQDADNGVVATRVEKGAASGNEGGASTRAGTGAASNDSARGVQPGVGSMASSEGASNNAGGSQYDTDSTILGVIHERALAGYMPFGKLQGLPPPALSSIRTRLDAWRQVCGPIGGRLIYLLDLEDFISEDENDDSKDDCGTEEEDDDEDGEQDEVDVDANIS